MLKARYHRRWAISIDGPGGKRLKGRIERLAPAAGSEFAASRPDNATGNSVKVTQRIAALFRIYPGQVDGSRLCPGMSVVERVKTVDQ